MNGVRASLGGAFAFLVACAMPVLAAAEPCAAPSELLASSDALRHVARAAIDRKSIRVLVVGSASSTTGGTTTQAAGYPARMEAALAAKLPGVAITVQTRGGRGMTAAELAPLIQDGLAEFHPDLVIWQTGTVDAVRGIDPDQFAATLEAGLYKAAAAGTDLMLIDQQFSRAARASLNFAPYRAAMEAAAAGTDATFFRRYDLMRHWAEAGQIDLERAARIDWQKTADLLHGCLGKALAASILDGMRQTR
jgi:lysophospholipase L1-like esterase